MLGFSKSRALLAIGNSVFVAMGVANFLEWSSPTMPADFRGIFSAIAAVCFTFWFALERD